jgi:hypothetical protein
MQAASFLFLEVTKGRDKFDTTVPQLPKLARIQAITTTTSALEFTAAVHTVVLDCWCCYYHTQTHMRTTDHRMQ